MRTRVQSIALALLASAAVSACTVEDITTFDTQTLATGASYRQLTRVDSAPYPSNVGSFDIDVYVGGDVADYEKIHPEDSGSQVEVATGTVIVRVVYGAGSSVAKLTMMARAQPGFDPTLGDWWFAETDADGQPLVDDGAPQLGRLEACHSCHVPRASESYLFGVPAADEVR